MSSINALRNILAATASVFILYPQSEYKIPVKNNHLEYFGAWAEDYATIAADTQEALKKYHAQVPSPKEKSA